MALVFKVKYGNTLRRWIVCDTIDAKSFCLTFQQVDQRIRELFDLSPSAVLVVTYIDKENDVITIADDKDLVDACIVQHLNPLRLEVQARDGVPGSTSRSSPGAFSKLKDDASIETYLHAVFSEGTANAIKQIINTHAPVVDLKLPTTTLLQSINGTLKELLQKDCRWAGKQNCPETKGTGQQKCQASSINAKKWEHDGNNSSQLCDWASSRGSKGSMSPIGAVHHGVQCDICGVYPIEGPRFKSMKIHNYDLCLSCFQTKGNETDYQKIEHPIYAPPFHGCHSWQCPKGPRPFIGSPAWRSSFTRGPYGWKSKCPFIAQQMDHEAPSEDDKILDARFVEDVTVSDGTEFAPGTKFTKIWRLKNSGLMLIPQSTKLMHVSGDILSSESIANLELPEGGVPCGQDFDASVDFVAPSQEGRYISYWQLLSPSGQKFGHRLWVEVQVVRQDEEPQFQESVSEETATTDAPTPGDGERAPVNKDVSSFDPVDINVEGSMSSDSSERASPSNGVSFEEWQSKQNPLFDRDVDGFSVIEMPTEAPSEQLADVFKETPDVQAAGEISQTSGQKHDVLAAEDASRAKEHLQILETMGFTNRDLNIALLDKNNQNIQQTLDDLLVSAGWDEVLKDLEEMGFDDRLTNIRLVAKNAGSLKRVVKDLMDMEKNFK